MGATAAGEPTPAPLGAKVRHVLVLGDSLTFHGPERPEPLTHPGLYPNVMAHRLDAQVDVVARMGWTARDAWWAVTKDPRVWSVLLPRADALVIAVGGMDQLPASLPTYLREGIAYVRPGRLRRHLRAAYRRVHPSVVRLTGGRMRQLPQAATDAYLTRLVRGVRHYRPLLPVVALAPAPYASADYPSIRGHRPAVTAARRWAEREQVSVVDLDPIVGPALAAGRCNPDGLHWSWAVHAAVGEAVATAVTCATLAPCEPSCSLPCRADPGCQRGDPS